MYMLGLITGAAIMAAAMLALEEKRARAAHKAHVQKWQRDKSGCAIIRTRHRRSDRHQQPAPLPLDICGAQLAVYGSARAKRIDGRWT